MKRLAILGNHLPRQCGIATFTTHLADALTTAVPDVDSFVLAMNDAGRRHAYPSRVRFEIAEGDLGSYGGRRIPERQSGRCAVGPARVRDLWRQGRRPCPHAPAGAPDADRDDASHRALGAQSGAARGDRRVGAALGASRGHERLGRRLAHARPRHLKRPDRSDSPRDSARAGRCCEQGPTGRRRARP